VAVWPQSAPLRARTRRSGRPTTEQSDAGPSRRCWRTRCVSSCWTAIRAKYGGMSGSRACWLEPGTFGLMIGWLNGTWHDGVVRTAAGVGYCVTPSDTHVNGEAVELFIHTIVREDSITLWGLPTAQDAAVFAALLKVQGVGPLAAMAVMRDAGSQKLAAAVAAQDPAMVRAKGVGPKTAARIIADIALPAGITAANVSPLTELADVLMKLGFDEATARTSAATAMEQDPHANEATQLAAALLIARNGGTK
jgi:Holliday junction DNA helicase RuvA